MNTALKNLRSTHGSRALYSLCFSLVGQVTALLLAFLLSGLMGSFFPVPPALVLAIQALLAYGFAHWLKMTMPWRLFNLLVGPAAVLSVRMGVPSELLAVAVLVLFLIFLPTFWTGVPYYPTSSEMYEVVLKNLPEKNAFKFIDLGCGFGELMLYLEKQRPAGVFQGVEISPLPYLICKLRFLFSGKSALKVSLKSFWNISLADYDFVYAFLAPGPMPELWAKVKKEMKSGSVFLTNSFAVEGSADAVYEAEDKRECKLYVHRIK